jgi:hypothetical protein
MGRSAPRKESLPAMKPAFLLVALLVFWPSTVTAQPPFGRQLHYAGTQLVDGRALPVTLDVDIGRLDDDAVTWIVIDEHLGDRDLGLVHVTLDKTGVIGERPQNLTFEEETVLSMVALQFEDVDGVEPGDHWDRRGTHYVVRSASDSIVDFEIGRNLAFEGGSGSWRGFMKYNAKTAAPLSIELTGDGPRGPVDFSARLVRDSFQPRTAELP